ncbi:hypothetical protein ACWIDW_04915 [Microbacterium sp. NPDC055312]
MTDHRLHYSSRTSRWMPCIAERACWYNEHSTPLGIAEAGGGEVAIHKRPQTIAPLIRGGYAIRTAERSQTFWADGTRMTPTEARAWRKKVETQQAIDEIVERGKVEHVLEPLTQREKAAQHAAEMEARRRAKMLVQPEVVVPAPRRKPGLSGYDAFLAAKRAREQAE